jgi:hypothetical protein
LKVFLKLKTVSSEKLVNYAGVLLQRHEFISELIGFWTLPIVQYSKILKIRELNVSETGSVSVLRSGGEGLVPSQLGPLERANLIQCSLIFRIF